jgi:hypothetical protein
MKVINATHSLIEVIGQLFWTEIFSFLKRLLRVIPNLLIIGKSVLSALHDSTVSCDQT